MLFLSATGLTGSTYAGANVDSLRGALGWSTPSLRTTGAGAHAGATAEPDEKRVDRVLAVARAAGIDADALEVAVPVEAGGPWRVAEVDHEWPTRLDAVAVDGTSGAVAGSVRFADHPVAVKVARWGFDAHTGALFGWPNQVALLVVGLGLVALVLLGYRMWWQRRPVRAGIAFGRPVARGQWRKASTSSVVALLVVTGLVGWFVPLLGASLVAFAVVDVLLGARASRRAG